MQISYFMFHIWVKDLYLQNSLPMTINFELVLIYSKYWFQTSTLNAYTLAIVAPITFILVAFLQYWIFHLYHKFGHPWSRILYPETDDIMRRENMSVEDPSEFFDDFWKQVENRKDEQVNIWAALSQLPFLLNLGYVHEWF